MELLYTIDDVRLWKARHQKPLAFVPTMGCLHEGHLSLVQCAQTYTPLVLMSIFFNASVADVCFMNDSSEYSKTSIKIRPAIAINEMNITPTADIVAQGKLLPSFDGHFSQSPDNPFTYPGKHLVQRRHCCRASPLLLQSSL